MGTTATVQQALEAWVADNPTAMSLSWGDRHTIRRRLAAAEAEQKGRRAEETVRIAEFFFMPDRILRTERDADSTVAPALLSVIAEDSDSLTSSEAALHALAPSANPPAASSVASSVMDAMAAMRTSDVAFDAVVGSEREAELVRAQQRAAAAEAQQQQMQAQFHQQMQMMEARMQAQLQQIQATVQQQPIVMPPTIQPTMHSSYPPTSAPVLVPAPPVPRVPRAAAAPPPAAASDSPAAGFTATWSQFKQFVQTSAPAAQRFRARIVDDQQQQIDALRSQVRTQHSSRGSE